MNNKILQGLTVALLATCMIPGHLSAQTETPTLKGVVTDKKNNPIVGAKVEIPGQPGFILTNPDGSFEFPASALNQKIKAGFSGFSSKSKKGKDGMKIKLSGDKTWKHVPEKWSPFVMAEAFFPYSELRRPAFGIMAGVVRAVGAYVKVGTNAFSDHSTDLSCYDMPSLWNSSYFNAYSPYPETLLTGKKHFRYTTVGGGIIVRLGCPLHLYAGASFVSWNCQFETIQGEWLEVDNYTLPTYSIDAGFMFRVKHVVLNAGVQVSRKNSYDDGVGIGNFGIGYIF